MPSQIEFNSSNIRKFTCEVDFINFAPTLKQKTS